MKQMELVCIYNRVLGSSIALTHFGLHTTLLNTQSGIHGFSSYGSKSVTTYTS